MKHLFLNSSSRDLIAYFLRAYPKRSALMIALLTLSGLGEGVGIISMLPLLDLAMGQRAGTEPSDLTRGVETTLAYVGLTPTVGIMLVLIVAGMALKAGFLWLAMRQVGFTVADVTKDLRLDLVRAVLAARWRHFSSRPVGQFANAISGEAIRAASAYREACSMLGALLQMLVYLGAAVMIAWRISIVAVVVGVGFVFVLRRFVHTSRDAGRDQTRLTRSLTGRLVDALRGIKAVKAMAREHLFWPLLEQEAEGLNAAHRRQVIASEGLKLFQEPLVTLALAAGLYAALTMTSLPFGAVLLLALIFYRLLRYVNTMQTRYQTLAIGESAFESLRGAVDQAKAEVEVGWGDRIPGPMTREIRFDSVSFAYDDEPLVSDVSLTVPAGSFVTFSGHSGAGKTTIVDMIAGLHLPVGGRIWVDDVPMTELNLRAWRSEIGYVPQEPLLFNDTIIKNVTLGDERFSREQVRTALEAAGAWEFVEKRPLGLDDPVGEAGGRLSGGQRQRVAIARALISPAPILILDEPSTGLDAGARVALAEPLGTLMQSRTTLVISHDLITTRNADQIVVLDGGEIVERGTHDDLLAAAGLYSRLWDLHAGSRPEPVLEAVA